MSTGLTYFSCQDTNGENSPYGTSSVVFADYSEARAYGEWLMTVTAPYSGGAFTVCIYTTGPSESGFYYWSGTAPVWVPQD